MYTLDFETMMQVMQEHRKTGVLYAEIPAGAVGIQEPCRIEIKLMAGTIVSYFIVSKSGQRLPEKEYLKRISRLGSLFWTLVPEVAAAAPPALPSPPPVREEKIFFPRRIVQVEQWQMRSWSRIHRGIFALADGTRSSAKIAEVLSVPQSIVEKALHDLQSIGVIAIRQDNGSGRP